jgi:hypothetical protein
MSPTGNGKRERAKGDGRRGWLRWAVSFAALVVGSTLGAQEIQLGGFGKTDAAKKDHVSLVSDAVQVEAGKPQVMELVFRVDPGFHINSHTPKDGLLIPTVLKSDAGSVKVLSESYAPGSPFRLSLPGAGGAGETLDVYQGEFRVGLRVVAPKGASTLTGSLRYQACDNEACFPARTLAVKVALTGR